MIMMIQPNSGKEGKVIRKKPDNRDMKDMINALSKEDTGEIKAEDVNGVGIK